MLKDAKAGVVAWNAYMQEEAMFSVGVLHIDGDNPMQSELSSHAGSNANCFCRKCMVGGTKAMKKTVEGYKQLFHVCSSSLFIGQYLVHF